MVNIGNDWDQVLVDEFKKEYYLKLREFLKSEYRSQQVFPDMYDIFNGRLLPTNSWWSLPGNWRNGRYFGRDDCRLCGTISTGWTL